MPFDNMEGLNKVLLRYGLPVERVDEKGHRFCRHHPEERIPRYAHPCKLCWQEGRGQFWPVDQDKPEESEERTEGPPGWEKGGSRFLELYIDPINPQGPLLTRVQAWEKYDERLNGEDVASPDPPAAPRGRRRKLAASSASAHSSLQSSPALSEASSATARKHGRVR